MKECGYWIENEIWLKMELEMNITNSRAEEQRSSKSEQQLEAGSHDFIIIVISPALANV